MHVDLPHIQILKQRSGVSAFDRGQRTERLGEVVEGVSRRTGGVKASVGALTLKFQLQHLNCVVGLERLSLRNFRVHGSSLYIKVSRPRRSHESEGHMSPPCRRKSHESYNIRHHHEQKITGMSRAALPRTAHDTDVSKARDHCSHPSTPETTAVRPLRSWLVCGSWNPGV